MSSAKRNYIYQVIYQLLSLLIPLVTAPYLTRTLGAEKLGIYTYTFTVAGVFFKIAELGIITHGSRSIAVVQENKELRSKAFNAIYTIQVISSLTLILIYIAYILMFTKEDRLIALLQALYVLTALFDISWFYMGMENFKKTVLRDTFVKILSVICIFLFVRSRNDLWKYTLVAVGSYLIGYLTLWFGVRKYVFFERPNWDSIKKHIRPIITLFIPTVAVLIYTFMDKLMLGNMSGKSEVAFYQYASTLVAIPLGFITSFGLVMLPRTSNMVAKNDDSVNKTINSSLLFMVFMSSAFTFGLSSISDELIPLYYGLEFLPCISVLVLLSIKLPFMAWANTIRTQALIPQHKDKQYITSLFIGAIINFILNAMLIPNFAANGAAVATIVAEISVCITQSIYTWKQVKPKKTVLQSLGFVIIGAIMYVVVSFAKIISNGTISFLLIEISIGAILYLMLSFMYFSVIIKKKNIIICFRDIVRFIVK